MNTASTRRSLWIALGGLALGILGVGWDKAWHSRHAGSPITGATEVLEAHWLMILGVVIIFVALAVAVRAIRQPRSAAISTWIAFVGSVLMVAGFAWDSARHVQGTEYGAYDDLCGPPSGGGRRSCRAGLNPPFDYAVKALSGCWWTSATRARQPALRSGPNSSTTRSSTPAFCRRDSDAVLPQPAEGLVLVEPVLCGG